MTELPSTLALIGAGIRAISLEHDKREQEKLGVLRAGNTGVLLDDGQVVGKCARLTYLRLIGVDADSDDPSREFMFAAGRTNEDSWIDLLQKAGVDRSLIKREEEIPVSWRTKSGREVSGRPDLVLMKREMKQVRPDYMEERLVPERGLELKLACSLWTARDVALKGQPKTMHLMQAAHYAWQLDCPFELWYTSRVKYAIPFGNFWPLQGQPGSEYLAYKQDGKPLKMIPFVVGYKLKWVGGDLFYGRIEHDGEVALWKKSIITKTGIINYYELVDDFALHGGPQQQMPPRPVLLTPTGEPGSYSPCDYCPLSSVCDRHEQSGVDKWQREVVQHMSQQAQVGSLKTR